MELTLPAPPTLISTIAVGSQVVVRDEEWLVSSTAETTSDGLMVGGIGCSAFVGDLAVTFFTNLDSAEPQEPEITGLIAAEVHDRLDLQTEGCFLPIADPVLAKAYGTAGAAEPVATSVLSSRDD
jgi:hypothetical protein